MTRNNRALRERVGDRDGWICWLCGLPVARELSANASIGATLDHVIPKSRGGEMDFENLRIAHFRCNQDRSNRTEANVGARSKFARKVKKRVKAHARKLRRKPWTRAIS